MPRKSQAETAATRQRLLLSAARLMRERGFDGVGVDDIVAAAGVTAGAFYTHFASKQALFYEVVELALAQAERYFPQIQSEDDIAAFVRAYLSDRLVQDSGAGCIVAAMAPDLTRSHGISTQGNAGQDKNSARHLAARYIQRKQTRISKALRERFGTAANDMAWQIVTQLIGAVIVSRIVDKPTVAKRVRTKISSQLAAQSAL
jgi:TetR/AcrR family transcriptional regulator, transcriptional repressor for nem operon